MRSSLNPFFEGERSDWEIREIRTTEVGVEEMQPTVRSARFSGD